jgi:hypothetical protein
MGVLVVSGKLVSPSVREAGEPPVIKADWVGGVCVCGGADVCREFKETGHRPSPQNL